MDAPLTHIPVHVRGGSILPTQLNATTTVQSRETPFTLVCALDLDARASGELFYDDGQTDIDLVDKYFFARFEMTNRTLAMHIEHNTYVEMSTVELDSVRIYNAPHTATQMVYTVIVNDQVTREDGEVTCEADGSVCLLVGLRLDMSKSFRIELISV